MYKDSDQSTPVRTITLAEDQLKDGNRSVLWNGLDSDGLPLNQQDAPYRYKLNIHVSGETFTDEEPERLLEAWTLATVIGDQPVGEETLVTGIDEDTITTSTLKARLRFYGEGSAYSTVGAYDIDEDQESEIGPSGNDWDAHVWLKNSDASDIVFYTTPATPANIRYDLELESLGDMVRDGVLNKWDMDETTTDFETKGTLVFGLNPASSTTPLRDCTGTYQEVP